MTNVLGIIIVTPEKKIFAKNVEKGKTRDPHILNKQRRKESEVGKGRECEIHF